MTNTKMIELTVLFYIELPLFAYTSLKFPFKSSCPLISSGGLSFGHEFHLFPRLLAS